MEITSIETIKSIKILGRDGCCNCSRMFQDTIDLAAENNLSADIQHVTDLEQVMKYGVMSLPGLVINEKVVSYGRILNKNEIKNLLKL
ncbi:MAG: thioredoxin family protein [Spirochaetales bacterium]|nr:thioredoxin family protein [Spirochaetales bacterium]